MSISTLTEMYMRQKLHGREMRELVHKFGHNEAVGATFEPVATGGIYRTPQVSSATTLRMKAGDANDTAAGSGAQEVTFQYLNPTGNLVEEAVATAGTSASAATTQAAIRLFRAWVSKSGTYASSTAGSHAADIVIENSAGTEDWAIIDVDGFATSQTEIGAYTVPLGFDAFIFSMNVLVDSNKDADILFFHREGVLKTSAPYDAMRLSIDFFGLSGADTLHPSFPIGPFPELTDLGFMAKAATAANVSVDFEIGLFLKDS